MADRPQTIYLGNSTAITRLHSGHKIYVDTRDTSIAPHLMLEGRWETWVENVLMANIKPGMVFCDVGANFGYYTLLGAQAVGARGQVYSFECNPRLYTLLRRSVMVNGLTDIIKTFPYAVTDKRGKVTLTFDVEFSGGGTTLDVRHASEWTRESAEVECGPLDEFIPMDVAADVLKIDVEGAEPLVLAGARRIFGNRRLQLVIVEYYAPSIARTLPPLEFLQTLASQGFTLQALAENGLEGRKSPEALVQANGSRMVYIHAERIR